MIKLLLIFIFVFAFLFVAVFIPTIPSKATKISIEQKALELKTPTAIHKYLWENNNYSFAFSPRNINKYWEDRIGDCTEIAIVKRIMYNKLGIKNRWSITWVNGSKHDEVIVKK